VQNSICSTQYCVLWGSGSTHLERVVLGLDAIRQKQEVTRKALQRERERERERLYLVGFRNIGVYCANFNLFHNFGCLYL
jgi:hypothetical protein